MVGLDFGTTNIVVAIAEGGDARLMEFGDGDDTGAVFRSTLCFCEEKRGWQGIAHEAGFVGRSVADVLI